MGWTTYMIPCIKYIAEHISSAQRSEAATTRKDTLEVTANMGMEYVLVLCFAGLMYLLVLTFLFVCISTFVFELKEKRERREYADSDEPSPDEAGR